MFSGIITTTASITQLEVERDTECVSKAVTEGLRARFCDSKSQARVPSDVFPAGEKRSRAAEIHSVALSNSHLSSILIKCSWNKPLVGVQEGESLALDGICLTVSKVDEDGFEAHLSTETLEKTTAKFWKKADLLNVERALKYQDFIGGHLVSGHVDAVGEIFKFKEVQGFMELVVKIPSHLERYVVEKGCIAVDGMSLTVNKVEKRDISFMLIPYTISHTTIAKKKRGDYVNIEVDILAKYVQKIKYEE